MQQNPPPKANGKRPDYKIEGRYFDHYAPTESKSARGIWSEVHNKVEVKKQADRIVINLDDCNIDMKALRQQFTDWQVPHLKEALVVKHGQISQFYP